MTKFFEIKTNTERKQTTVLLHTVVSENETEYTTKTSVVSTDNKCYPTHFQYPYNRIVKKNDINSNRYIAYGLNSTRKYLSEDEYQKYLKQPNKQRKRRKK